jgi:hypothetical protein
MRRTHFLLVPLLAVVLVACGDDSSSGSSTPSGPTIEITLPATNHELAPHDVIEVRFDRELDPATIGDALQVISQTTGVISGTTNFVAPDTLIFTPSAPFLLSDAVSVTVATTLADLDGFTPSTTQTRAWNTVGRTSLVQNSSLLRSSATATVLHDGRVLIVGGATRETEAVIFNPSNQQFTPTGSLTEGRLSHQAVLLDDGRVAVVGGQSSVDSAVRDSIEIWNPATDAWTTSSATIAPRSEDHVLYRIEDATLGVRWIVVGGYSTVIPSEVVQEAIDVLSADMSAVTASSETVGLGGKSAQLQNGDIVLVGSPGLFGSSDDVQVLSVDPSAADPIADVATFTDVLPNAAAFINIRRLPGEDRLLLDANGVLNLLEITYTGSDPTGATAVAGPAYAGDEERRYVLFDDLQDGRVFISTGRSMTTLGSVGKGNVFDPSGDSLALSLDLNPRRVHNLAQLDDGRLLNFSGRFQLTGQILNTMDVISREALLEDSIAGASGAFSTGITPRANAGTVGADLAQVRVYFTGGLDVSTATASVVQLEHEGAPLTVTVSVEQRRQLVVHLPAVNLLPGDTLEFSLQPGLVDRAGNPVDLSVGVTTASWTVR